MKKLSLIVFLFAFSFFVIGQNVEQTGKKVKNYVTGPEKEPFLVNK